MSANAARAKSNAAAASDVPAQRPLLHRSCACGTHTQGGGTCAECAKTKRRQAQRSALGAMRAETRDADAAHAAIRAPGQSLDPALRKTMESRFERDFSGVRIHHDNAAAHAAESIGAAAYTVGDDIVFGHGHYRPQSPTGAHLLAHELAHVAQHRAFGSPLLPADASISRPDDASEREADGAAERIVRGERVRVGCAPQASLHRLSDGAIGGIVAGSIVGAGLIGVGIAALAGAFDADTYSEADLRAYLDLLARNRSIENNRNSDNKARDLVRRWAAGEGPFNLDAGHRSAAAALTGVELKRLLIREMLSGATAGADENAILTLLERSTTDDIIAILDPAGGVSIQDIDSDVNGDNHDRFERLLEERMPRTGANAAPQRAQASSACSARQALMLHYARDRATRMVENAIQSLSQTPRSEGTNGALNCRFQGATETQIGQLRTQLERVRPFLSNRIYVCGTEGGAAELGGVTIRLQDGRTYTSPCLTENASSAGLTNGSGGVEFSREVALCPQFFRTSPVEQAITLVHESVHSAGVLEDPRYQPGCGLDAATALRNPDSYAYLASDLLDAGATSAAKAPAGSKEAGDGMPQVTIGNFRNSGALSAENRCEVCADLPGLGLDANTFLNIMEVRGDISGHRANIEYDFKRSKDRAIWRLDGTGWTLLNRATAGTADDRFQSDEFLTPVDNHIYAVDGPGLERRHAPIPNAASAQEAVYIGTYVETVEARRGNGAWTTVSNAFPWHSVTWIENVGGSWQRKAGENRIEPGAIVIGDTPPQPTSAAAPGAPAPSPTPTPSPAPGPPPDTPE